MSRRPLILLAVALATGACGEPAPTGPAGPLEQSFALAAAEYQVPVELLKGIAWVQSRFLMHPGEPSIDGGYGLLHLADREGDRGLVLAMELTGLSREQLITDPAANLRGGAAVLRARADEHFRAYPALRETELSDWYDVVTRTSGIDDLRIAEEYANRVFYSIENGVERTLPDGQTVELRPAPVNLTGKRAFGETHQFSGTDGFPGAVWSAANSGNYSSGRQGHSINYVVVHTVQGSYAGAISWFRNAAANVSAHYVISDTGDVTQMLHHADTGWHAGNSTYNKESIGLEHEGFVSDPAWATPAMYATSAALTRWICDMHGIPRDRNHILGHVEIPNATHTDPGPHWNWGTYMGLINGGAPAPTTGVLRGVVYVDPDTGNRITGASVRLGNGMSATTDGSGAFRFDVEPGDHTVTASAAGYAGGSVQRQVQAGAESWGSVGLRPQTATGIYRGAVFELAASDPCRADPATTCDMSTKLDGALVTLSDGSRTITITSGLDNDQREQLGAGRIWAEVPAGRWTATAQLAGFAVSSTTREIVAGQETWGSVGLLREGAADTTAPVVTLESPLDGAVITDLPELSVRGSVADASLPPSVLMNDVEVALAGGRFEGTLRLVPGANQVTVLATDSAGNEGRASATVTYAPPPAGLDGFVFLAPDEAARLEGALVELGQHDLVLATTTTAADGSFHLDVPAGGDHVLAIFAAGFQLHTETVTVPEGGRLSTRFGLYPGGELAHFVEITSPADGATVGTSSLLVAGITSIYGGSLTVNGVPAQLGAEGGRDRSGFAFTATVPLLPGENTLEAVMVKGEVTLTHRIRVTLVDGLPATQQTATRESVDGGGCSSSGATPATLLGLGLVAAALARRRVRQWR